MKSTMVSAATMMNTTMKSTVMTASTMMAASSTMTAAAMTAAAMAFREGRRRDEQASGDCRYEGEFA